jgi:hypothetical protein
MAVANRTSGYVQEQAAAAHEQVGILSQQMVVEHRAWVSSKIEVTGPMNFNGGAAFLPLGIEMINVGHSPAESVKTTQKLVVSIGGPLPKAEVMASCKELKQSSQPSDANGWILFPNQKAISKVQGAGLPQKDVQAGTVNNFYPGKVNFALVTCVDYTMRFDKSRHHQTIQTYAVLFPNSSTGGDDGYVEPVGKRNAILYLQPDSYVD